MSAMRQDTLALGELEWDCEAADGCSLTTGEAWFGTRVEYRRIGTRNWDRFYVLDVHTWETEKLHAAINEHVRLNGTRR